MDIREAIHLLELKSSAQPQDIKKQFYRLAHLYHPDKNPDEAALNHFRQIMDAYEFCQNHLSEVSLYFEKIQPKKVQVEPTPVKLDQKIEPVEDIFEDIFGYSKSGRILGYQEPQILYLKLSEFASGTQKKQKLVAYRRCETCQGVGAKKGNSVKLCRYCFGQGTILKKNQPHKPWQICGPCQGRGKIVINPCLTCQGFGRVRQHHLQEFSLPVGMQPFFVYALESLDLVTRMAAQIFIEPRLLLDEVFQIENYDLVCQYHLDLKNHQQELTVNVQAPLGRVKLVIPALVKNHDVICLAGEGLYKEASKQARGDLRVTVVHKEPSLFERIFRRLFGNRKVKSF